MTLLLAGIICDAQDSTNEKKELQLNITYYLPQNNVPYLLVTTKTKVERKFIGVKDLKVNVYLNSTSDSDLIQSFQSNATGEERIYIPPSFKRVWDAASSFTFIAVAAANKEFDETKGEVQVTKAKIEVDTSRTDETKNVTVTVKTLQKGEWIPTKDVEIKIVGESLFNDGVGVVLFLSLLEIISIGTENISSLEIILLLVKEIGGGILFGWVLGLVGYRMMKKIDHYETEILITLAMVMGGYMLAQVLHISGPLAMVAAGLLTGNRSREQAMSKTTKLYIDKFWELIDVLMNAILFVLIGLELLTLKFNLDYLLAGLIAIPVTLFARYVSLLLPASLFKRYIKTDKKTVWLMTWGGLRGGLSIAMALSLTAPLPKDQFVFMIYVIVMFSIIVQGLTVGKLVKKLF